MKKRTALTHYAVVNGTRLWLESARVGTMVGDEQCDSCGGAELTVRLTAADGLCLVCVSCSARYPIRRY